MKKRRMYKIYTVVDEKRSEPQISGEGDAGWRTADLASIRPNGRHTPFANGARLLAGPEPNSCLDWQKVINCKYLYRTLCVRK